MDTTPAAHDGNAHPPSAPAEIPATDTSSLRAAIGQGAAWAVMFGAGEVSFSLFAAFRQVPTHLFGRLAGLPNLLGPIAQVVSANLVERYGRRRALVLLAVMLQALCFVPLVLLAVAEPGPWLFWTFLGVTTTYHVAGHFANPPWTSLIGDLVPADARGAYFARLSRVIGSVSIVAQLAVMGALYLGPHGRAAAWVYAVAFAASGLARLISFGFISRMVEPPYERRADSAFTMWRFFKRVRESNFVKFVIFVSLVHLGANLAGPFFLPYAIYDLGWKQWEWMALQMVAQVTSVGTLLLWGRFSERFGNWRTLKYTSVLVSLVPVTWLLSDSYAVLFAFNIVSGAAWAGFGLSTWNYVLEAVSPPKRPRCVAYFNVTLGVGIFLGCEIGGLLMRIVPGPLSLGPFALTVSHAFSYALLASVVMRGLAVAVFLPMFRELRHVEPLSLRERIFQIARLRPGPGLRFSAVPAPPAGTPDPKPQETETRTPP